MRTHLRPPPAPRRSPARNAPARTAQYLHRLDVRVTRGAEGKSGRVFVGDMSEDNAVQLASKAVSEGFIYGVSSKHVCHGEPTMKR